MRVDTIAFAVSCIWEVHIAQAVTQHGDVSFVPELTLTSEFEAKFTSETTGTGAGAGRAHATQGDRLIEKLELSILAGLTRVFDRQFMRTGSVPP